MATLEHDECLWETLQELREDAALLRMSLLGGEDSIDRLTFACLLRLSNYLDQHVRDIHVLCRK